MVELKAREGGRATCRLGLSLQMRAKVRVEQLVSFIDASSHLYKRACSSVRRSVGDAFVKNKGNQYFRANKCQKRFSKLTRCIIASL